MHTQTLITFAPLLLISILAAFGVLFSRLCKFVTPKEPYWPFAEQPGLALELADSRQFVDKVLGEAGASPGDENRKAAQRFQYIDFPFIAFYIAFFLSVPFVRNGFTTGCTVILVLAVLTGLFDVIEDVQILRMVRDKGGSAKRFGQAKWLFYFLTVAAEGSLFFFEPGPSPVRSTIEKLIGAALIGIAIGGIISSTKGSFEGISSASKLSALGLLVLSLTPVIVWYPYSLRYTAEYAVLLRVPLFLGLLLLALPFIAFFSGAKVLLRGLFDLTPLSLFVVTITALAVSGTACVTASIILSNANARFPELNGFSFPPLSSVKWLGLMLFLSIFIIVPSVKFSAKQGHNTGRLILAALSGIGLVVLLAVILLAHGSNSVSLALPYLTDPRFINYLRDTGLFAGYVQGVNSNYDPWPHHLFALAAFFSTAVLYVIVGVYGWSQLGKRRTVPALCSALMLVLMLGWMLSALTFFLDAWHIPTILIVAVVGVLTAQSHRSDHFYNLRERVGFAADAADTITASGQSRVIVVAANGGGIQAGAWAAKVCTACMKTCGKIWRKSSRDLCV